MLIKERKSNNLFQKFYQYSTEMLSKRGKLLTTIYNGWF